MLVMTHDDACTTSSGWVVTESVKKGLKFAGGSGDRHLNDFLFVLHQQLHHFQRHYVIHHHN